MILESGGAENLPAAQKLNRGRLTGDGYLALDDVRRRQVGGTVNTWNTEVAGLRAAKYVPLDSIDFERDPSDDLPGWPIEYEALLPWYRKAHTALGLGPFDYDASRWQTPDRPIPDALSNSALLRPSVYQFGTAANALAVLGPGRSIQQNGALRTGCTALRLLLSPGSDRVLGVDYACEGDTHRLTADTVVIAGGAVENARLLLLSGLDTDAYPALGRCFMEHPRDYALRLAPGGPALYEQLRFFDQHCVNETTVMGRVAFRAEALREFGSVNGSISLFPQLAASSKPVRWAREAMRRLGLRRLGDYPQGGSGWSDRDIPRSRFKHVQLLVNLEQIPEWDNRVTLDAERDEFDQPRTALHYRLPDAAAIHRTRQFIRTSLEATELGAVTLDPSVRPDPNAHHHAGTTRMSKDVRYGVVDDNCRVHGLENAFVAGASVFPTAGYANPTLTIVAMSLRLARHLE